LSVVARRYFLRGRMARRRGEVADAREAFAAAVELCPSFVEARLGLAAMLLRDDPPRAVQTLRAGLTLATRGRRRRFLLEALGEAQVLGGDFIGADATLSEAATLPGAGPELWLRIARLRARTHRFAEAFAAFAEAAAQRRG
jgi:cytochrome c-type biogenesis protein CcmH/NrfG